MTQVPSWVRGRLRSTKALDSLELERAMLGVFWYSYTEGDVLRLARAGGYRVERLEPNRRPFHPAEGG